MIVQPADLSVEKKISVESVQMCLNLQSGSFVKIKYTKVFTPESSKYQSLYLKTVYVFKSVILSKKHFFGTKLLHAYAQCVYIVKAKYQIVLSRAVVGVDPLMKELS